jgi:predicted ArsR family transcriptional regulator
MPLKKRSIWATRGATLRKHIKKLQAEGYPHTQALAIALHAARGGRPNSQFTQRLKARVKNFKVPTGLRH